MMIMQPSIDIKKFPRYFASMITYFIFFYIFFALIQPTNNFLNLGTKWYK